MYESTLRLTVLQWVLKSNIESGESIMQLMNWYYVSCICIALSNLWINIVAYKLTLRIMINNASYHLTLHLMNLLSAFQINIVPYHLVLCLLNKFCDLWINIASSKSVLIHNLKGAMLSLMGSFICGRGNRGGKSSHPPPIKMHILIFKSKQQNMLIKFE